MASYQYVKKSWDGERLRLEPGHKPREVTGDRHLVGYINLSRMGKCACYGTIFGHPLFVSKGLSGRAVIKGRPTERLEAILSRHLVPPVRVLEVMRRYLDVYWVVIP
jgi:hypothetical protein